MAKERRLIWLRPTPHSLPCAFLRKSSVWFASSCGVWVTKSIAGHLRGRPLEPCPLCMAHLVAAGFELERLTLPVELPRARRQQQPLRERRLESA